MNNNTHHAFTAHARFPLACVHCGKGTENWRHSHTKAVVARDEALAVLAKDVLGLETLDTRNSDSLDFSEQAVWTLKAALEAAYDNNNARRPRRASRFRSSRTPNSATRC